MNDLKIALLAEKIAEIILNEPFEIAVAALAESAKGIAESDDDLTFISEKINEVLSDH